MASVVSRVRWGPFVRDFGEALGYDAEDRFLGRVVATRVHRLVFL